MSLMKLMLLLFLLDYLDFTPLAADANAKCVQKDLYILKEASIIRGNYKDVQTTSQINGGLLSSARTNILHMPGIDNSPLRNSLYGPYGQGHVDVNLGLSIIVQFLQAYQINTVRFWMWDYDNLLTNIQVSTIAADRKTETVIFENLYTKSTVYVVKFSDQFASGLKFYNRGGNNVNSDMTLIKIQAYYAF